MVEKIVNYMVINGEVASSGVARGQAFVCSWTDLVAMSQRKVGETQAQKELEKFDAAVVVAEKELIDLQKNVHQTIGKQESMIFGAQILLLHDPMLRNEVSSICLNEKINVEAALELSIDKLTALFVKMQDPYFRERAADLRDVGKRLQNILGKSGSPRTPVFPNGSVIVTNELLPSIVAQLNSRTIRGLILEKGGQTAHATILARAEGIPVLIHVPDAMKSIHTGDRLIVDGLVGRVFINPTPAILHEYDLLEKDLKANLTALKGLINLPAVTLDGIQIKLCSNIGKFADAVTAAKVNAEGIGLYRTELAFLVQDHFPSEEEQYAIYRKTADRVAPREVVIRVLDIGSDKVLPYFSLPFEVNPSLGSRGIRLLLAHPEILHTQLRAILRLSATHPVSILFPMVGGVEDMLSAKVAIEKAKTSLTTERQLFNQDILVGAMIEIPSAAIMIGRLAHEVDYFSIGTNDLVQYLLTIDRASSDMASYYEPLHPAILKMLAFIVAEVKTKGKSLSICGEMAGNPAYTQLLLGIGFRSFSVSPGEILAIKNVIRSTNIQKAENLAQQVLELGTIREIKDCLHCSASKAVSSPAG